MYSAKKINAVGPAMTGVVMMLAALTTHLQVLAVTSSSNVIQLTTMTFSSVVRGNELVMVQLYAPWCPHCLELAPQYELAAARMDTGGAIFAKVDCTAEDALCDSQGVLSYPTLKVYRNGESEVYQGHLKADAMIAFLQS
ncbi:protein disulfide-isomerase precursor [Linnemannia exigua]|uniref:Protein disulfide-isomerase n=1 Tax=Linnemannia exigua TaxID=604196 RepID=A0AAD4H9I3_9FUNG|nr:protein disulfide-isomerase precursor [Linnemannia exigua]